MWGGKRYYGTLIRETKTHKFARTENGKIKKIKKEMKLEVLRFSSGKDSTSGILLDSSNGKKHFFVIP